MTGSHPPLPPANESAKQRARRIPLDYHRQVTRLDRAKWILTCLIGIAGAIYAGWMLIGWWLQSPAALAQFSPAPVAAPHAVWDQKCEVCHIPGVPLRGDAIGSGQVAAWIQRKPPANHAASDAKCSACHAGPAHHTNQLAAEVQACASCHRDHQGKGADLARVADSVCTSCHANIAQHRSGPSLLPGPEVNVASLAAHPQFRSLAGGDPGRLKFNHQQHMLPGQVPSDAKTSLRAASKIAQLECAYCHQPDGAGQYMQPIDYDRHCATCHADDLVLKGDVSGPIPHGLKAADVRTVLVGLAKGAKIGSPGLSPSRPLQPIPGKTPGNNLAQQLAPEVATAIEQAERLLTGADAAVGTTSEAFCAKCHTFGEKSASAASMPEIVPTAIPARWFAHARFDHAAHRNMKCADCHAGALPPAGSKTGDIPLDHAKLLIPNLDKCRECHTPAGTTPTSGARFDCVECHKYHGHTLTRSVSEGRQLSLAHASGLYSRRTPQLSIEFVSTTSADPTPPLFVGSASCASAGCHGKSFDGKTRDWQTAYSVWAAEDPHRRAFDVLYAERSLEIYRNLTPGANRLTTPPSDADYLTFLQQRCVGCHAMNKPGFAYSRDPAQITAEIGCESCHGAAGGWLHSHYTTGWRDLRKNRDYGAPYFHDLTDSKTQASVCLNCHLGSRDLDRAGFTVNHDLIAAGHPRLLMELEANLANYPAHWNRVGKAGSHYRHWLAGREEARARLGRFGANPQNLAEFSAFECFDCHHALQSPIKPRPGIVRQNRALLAPWPLPIVDGNKRPDMVPFLSLIELQNPAEQTWDEAVLLYLGSSAIVRDLPENHADRAELVAATAKLASTLQEMAGQTQYDSPARFDPGKLAEPFSEVAKTLRPIANSTAGAAP